MSDMPPTSPAPASTSGSLSTDAGIAAIFDFTFKRFITLSVMKVLFMLGMVLIGLGWLMMVVSGFTAGGVLGGVGALVIGTVLVAVQVVFFRVWLELIVVIFRIAENTSILVEQNRAAGR